MVTFTVVCAWWRRDEGWWGQYQQTVQVSSKSISDGPGKEGQAADWIFGPAKPGLNSWLEITCSPALWQTASIICTAFSFNIPHAKSPNLDISYIFYQLKVHMCWGCSLHLYRTEGINRALLLRTPLSPGPNLHWPSMQASPLCASQ